MYILAIDTSCDETSASVVYQDRILSNIIYSQIKFHTQWGGCVPSIAKRMHLEYIDTVIDLALRRAGIKWDNIDYIAVTQGPGLAIALEVGINKAKELSNKYQKPIVAINHMEGHIYSALSKNSLGQPTISYTFPLLALLISGGHTELILMINHSVYKILGKTLDDAIGECFDKVARSLNLGYPGGPVIEKLARLGDENAYTLTVPMANSNDLNMSYSGLKTQTLNLITNLLGSDFSIYTKNFSSKLKNKNYLQNSNLNSNISKIIKDIAASFQKIAVKQLLMKTEKSLILLQEKYNIKVNDLIIAGGVAQNKYLKKMFKNTFKDLNILFPTSKKLFTDNAGMVGVAAYFNLNFNQNSFVYLENKENLDRVPNLKLTEIKLE